MLSKLLLRLTLARLEKVVCEREGDEAGKSQDEEREKLSLDRC
jgi:hypothetical protein